MPAGQGLTSKSQPGHQLLAAGWQCCIIMHEELHYTSVQHSAFVAFKLTVSDCIFLIDLINNWAKGEMH